jgi:hypothetical protein
MVVIKDPQIDICTFDLDITDYVHALNGCPEIKYKTEYVWIHKKTHKERDGMKQ